MQEPFVLIFPYIQGYLDTLFQDVLCLWLFLVPAIQDVHCKNLVVVDDIIYTIIILYIYTIITYIKMFISFIHFLAFFLRELARNKQENQKIQVEATLWQSSDSVTEPSQKTNSFPPLCGNSLVALSHCHFSFISHSIQNCL